MKLTRKNTVFILGAGASVAAGAPLMRTFLDQADELWTDGKTTWASPAFEEVFEAREKLQSAFAKSFVDLDNVESLFATFEMASLLGTLGDMPKALVPRLPEALRRLVFRTIELSLKFQLVNHDSEVCSPHPYDAFARLVVDMHRTARAGKVSVVSFNYDLGLDYAIARTRAPMSYGLDEVDAGDDAILVLKPHGSLNWTQNPTGEIHASPVQPLNSTYYWRRLGIRQNITRELAIDTMELLHSQVQWGEEPRPPPYIVPPTWNKADYQRQLANVWRRSADVIGEATNIVVIGYSLPPSDQFFRSFLALGLATDKMIDTFSVFDPSPTVPQWESLCGPSIVARKTFHHYESTFVAAIGELNRLYLSSSPAVSLLLKQGQPTAG